MSPTLITLLVLLGIAAVLWSIYWVLAEYDPTFWTPKQYRLLKKKGSEFQEDEYILQAKTRIGIWREYWIPKQLLRKYSSIEQAQTFLSKFLEEREEGRSPKYTYLTWEPAVNSPKFDPLPLIKEEIEKKGLPFDGKTITLKTGSQLVLQ